jgi:hypothetical protein
MQIRYDESLLMIQLERSGLIGSDLALPLNSYSECYIAAQCLCFKSKRLIPLIDVSEHLC